LLRRYYFPQSLFCSNIVDGGATYIYRILEGYPLLNPESEWRISGKVREFMKRRHINKYETLLKRAHELKNKGTPENPECEKYQEEYRQVRTIMAIDYPYEINHILPTRLGNIIRAFETYSLHVYGIDAIPLWFRIIAVVPKEFMDRIEGAKASVDFFVNTSVLSLLIFALLILYSAVYAQYDPVFYAPAAVVISLVSYAAACNTAVGWGGVCESGFRPLQNENGGSSRAGPSKSG
jgi:hypothetical protein